MENWRALAEQMVWTQIYPRGISNEKILEAMMEVPRHRFIPEEYRRMSYADCALPIGLGQTISQPYIVAKMTDLLLPRPVEVTTLLEIGTGSGYQAAVLSQMGMKVCSIERIETLGSRAKAILEELGYSVEVLVADGREGHPGRAPYGGILVTAAAEQIEPPWIDQLDEGGRLVVPLRIRSGLEQLLVREKKDSGTCDRWYDHCTFVPLLKGVIPEDTSLS